MLHQQAWAFAVALLTGAAAGLVFDFYRAIRQILGLQKIGTAIGDFVTIVLVSLLTFSLLVIGNWAELRVFIGLAMICGLVLYYMTASPVVIKSVTWLIGFGRSTTGMLLRIVKMPLVLFLRLLSFPVFILAWFSHLTIRVVEYLVCLPQMRVQRAYRDWINREPPSQS